MWNGWSSANCPVCKDTLGHRKRGEIFTFLCEECQFWFTWDQDGKILKPQTNHPIKSDGCECGSCIYRAERKKNQSR